MAVLNTGIPWTQIIGAQHCLCLVISSLKSVYLNSKLWDVDDNWQTRKELVKMMIHI